MPSALVATFLTLAGAAAASWRLGLAVGEPRAVGLLGGVLLGAAVALVGAGWQRRTMERRPKLAVHAVAGTMLVKLVVLGLVAVTLGFVPAVAERAEVAPTLLGFVGAAVLVGALATRDAVRSLRPARADGSSLSSAPFAGAPDSPNVR